jgi:hypothetical protein
LLGAILLKARALAVVPKKELEHREDLIRLLTFVHDPRAMAKEMTGNERKWLRRIEPKLALDDATPNALSASEVELARQAFALLS